MWGMRYNDKYMKRSLPIGGYDFSIHEKAVSRVSLKVHHKLIRYENSNYCRL